MTTELDLLNVQTMTSLEIAELTGKRHDNVLVDIDAMYQELGVDLLKIQEVKYKAGNGQMQPMHKLDKDMTMTLISGYNVKLRFAVMKRWRELEEAKSKPLTQIQMVEQYLVTLKELEASNLLLATEKANNTKLVITLDEAEHWSSIKKQEKINLVKYKWQSLKRYSIQEGYEIKKVFDQNYGEVNSYCAEVWMAVHQLDITVDPIEF